mgnify:FL=1
MGLFDTVHLLEPLELPGLDEPVTEIQTKHFGSVMEDYTVGSILPESPVLIGILEETVWCKGETEGEEGRLVPVYFAIWHRILAGVYLDSKAAEERLRTVDRLDLIHWLDTAQGEAKKWRRRHGRFYWDIQKWHEHLNRPESERADYVGMPWHLPEEILNAPDPLGAILERHRVEKE